MKAKKKCRNRLKEAFWYTCWLIGPFCNCLLHQLLNAGRWKKKNGHILNHHGYYQLCHAFMLNQCCHQGHGCPKKLRVENRCVGHVLRVENQMHGPSETDFINSQLEIEKQGLQWVQTLYESQISFVSFFTFFCFFVL